MTAENYYRVDVLEDLGCEVFTVRLVMEPPGWGSVVMTWTGVGPPDSNQSEKKYVRGLPADSTDEDLDAIHQRTIARVRSREIAWPRSKRPSMYDLLHIIEARAREVMREIPPDKIEDYRQPDAPNLAEWSPLCYYVASQITDEFDVQDPNYPDDDPPEELLEFVYQAVETWVAEYEARAAGLPPPVMTARDREIFQLDLALDILKDKPPGTTYGEALPDVQAKLAELERLRPQAGE